MHIQNLTEFDSLWKKQREKNIFEYKIRVLYLVNGGILIEFGKLRHYCCFLARVWLYTVSSMHPIPYRKIRLITSPITNFVEKFLKLLSLNGFLFFGGVTNWKYRYSHPKNFEMMVFFVSVFLKDYRCHCAGNVWSFSGWSNCIYKCYCVQWNWSRNCTLFHCYCSSMRNIFR